MRLQIALILFIVMICFATALFAQSYEGEKGDVNNDGTVNILDALNVVNHILETNLLDDQGFWRADCNSSLGRCGGDSVVNVLDVVKIVNIVLEVDFCGIVDIDGNVYRTVTIGTQVWMAENLKVTHYRNGDAIPCWSYNNDPSHVATYGLLYDWYAVDDSRKITPQGWHVPSDDEWKQLEIYSGMSQSQTDSTGRRGTDEGGRMKETGTSHWYSPNTGATNESGFIALPGGDLTNMGTFYGLGQLAVFWSSTESAIYDAWYRYLGYDSSEVGRDNATKEVGFSVRCVRDIDNTAPTASFIVDPASGTAQTLFNVDASGSSDLQDPTSVLQVLWDWEDDGTYDTDWTTTKTASHQYLTTGTKTIKLEVKDTGGLTDTETKQVTILSPGCGTVTDIDGNTYQTIRIGGQCWMAENLKVTHYSNGDPILNITDNTEWYNLPIGAYCDYNNDANYVATYGRLYNWYAVNDGRKITPAGWHIPSDEEWKQLERYLGMAWGR